MECLKNMGFQGNYWIERYPICKKIFEMHLGDCYEGKRVILAVDAADVSPRVIIHKNGQIDGFLNEDALVPGEQASALRASLQHLRDFVSEHQKDIVKDFFLWYLCVHWKIYM